MAETWICTVWCDVFDIFYFADKIKNIRPKEELEEEKHSKMAIDSESSNEESESENGTRTLNYVIMDNC